MKDNRNFFFTYGSEGQPFRGGWTVISAPDRATACAIFRLFHPDKVDGLLNCCKVYTDDDFFETSMFRYGNLGARLQERITVQQEIFATGAEKKTAAW